MKTIEPVDWAIILCSSVDRGLLARVVGPKPKVPTGSTIKNSLSYKNEFYTIDDDFIS